MSNDACLRNEWKETAEVVRRNLQSGAHYSNATRDIANKATADAAAAQAQVEGLRKEIAHLRKMVVGVMSNGNFG